MADADYIIVGAGSAGCALARRLSDDSRNSVLMIEAGGPDRNPFIHMPRGVGKASADPAITWQLPVTRPGGSNEVENWTRGKVMGGSSSVNGMVYFRGFRHNFDGLGIPGWGWDDMVKAYKGLENHELGAGPERGDGGPFRISLHHRRDPICEDFIAATQTFGVTRVVDMNDDSDEIVGYQPRTIWRGRRSSAAKAFIDPVRGRENLRILTHTLALRLVFEGRRAVGIQVRDGNGERVLRAGREIILTLGALHTPKLLLLSGIGPSRHLSSLGIPVLQDAEVGENLVEQRVLTPSFRISYGSHNHEMRGARLVKNVLQYGLMRSGVMTSAVFEIASLFKSSPDVPHPDAKLSFSPYSFTRTPKGAVVHDEPGASFLSYQMFPRSRGRLRLTSSDPVAHLDMTANFLSDEYDRKVSVSLIRRARALMAHDIMKKYNPVERFPGAHVDRDDEIVDAYLRQGSSGLHTVGTCRMGSDDRSVVDPHLKVRGVEGLRVADISVLPEQVASNTNAQAVAIGWRAADVLRAG